MSRDRDITITKGYDYQHELTFVDENDVAINVSAYTYVAYLALSGTTVATFSTNAASAASGVVVVSLTDAQTSALTAGARYTWVVEQDVSGVTTPVVIGNATVLAALRS